MKKMEDVVIDYIDAYIEENYRLPHEILVHTYLYIANAKHKRKTGENLHDGKYVLCTKDEDGIFHGYTFYPEAHEIYKKIQKNEIKGQPVFVSKEARERYESDINFRNYVDKKYRGQI